MELTNQHVFITGGSSGIGFAIARQAAAEGARLTLVARDLPKLLSAAALIRSAAPSLAEIVTVSVDVSVESEIVAACKMAQSVHGPIDILITSAGISHPGYFEELPTAVFERTMAVNYFGTLYAIRAVIPSMRFRRSGSVVIISSGAGLVGVFGYSAYSPSKFALRGLAESLRGELKPIGISVTIVYPPDTSTPQLFEENLTKPIETKAITSGGGLWTADSVARTTLTAVKNKKFSVTPGIQITMLSLFHSVIAPLLRRWFDWLSKRARRRANREARPS